MLSRLLQSSRDEMMEAKRKGISKKSGESSRILDNFKGRAIGFADGFGHKVREREDSKMTLRILT